MSAKTVKLLVNLVLLLTCVKCSVSRNPKGPKSAKIVDGTNAGEFDHPYMVHIRRYNQHFCGGTVLTPYCVLTAAHCLRNVNDDQFDVYAGSVRLDAAETAAHHDVRVSKIARRIIPHNFVESPTYTFMDVAILVLESPLQGVNIEAVKIDLEVPVKDGDSLTLLGWGIPFDGAKNYRQHLQVVNVTGLSNESCDYFYSNTTIEVSQSDFCHLITDGKTTCMGDSGGPAMRNGKQVGIASWGLDCGRRGHPSAFTSLAYHRVARFLNYYKRRACY